ncbi:hypothetical protein EJB05_04173, partial [Eragrostis curvula]
MNPVMGQQVTGSRPITVPPFQFMALMLVMDTTAYEFLKSSGFLLLERTGPKRGIVMVADFLFWLDMRIKTGEKEE